MESVTNCIRIESNDILKISPEGDFFRVWVDFLKPVHDLTKREMDVLALFLKERYRLSKKISDEEILNRELMSTQTRIRIREQCGIKPKHLDVIMSTFREKHIIVNNKFFLKLIPEVTKDGAVLKIIFDFKDAKQLVKLGH